MSEREKLQNHRGTVILQKKLFFISQDEGRQVENKQLKTMQAVSGKQLPSLELKFPPR